MWHLYPIRVQGGRRREVFEYMREQGVLVQVNYIPAYWHPAFEDLGYKRGMCPNAELYYEQEISLPMYADLTPDQVSRVIDVLRSALSAGPYCLFFSCTRPMWFSAVTARPSLGPDEARASTCDQA